MSKKADKWVRWYYEVVADTGAPALDPVDSQGRVFDDLCKACDFKHRHWSDDKKHWVCGHCGVLWGYHDVTMFKGEIETQRRPGGSEHRLSRRIDVGTQFSQFTQDPKMRWEARLYVANCLGFSIRHLTANGRKTWGQGFVWNYRQVREAIILGRLEWTKRMASIGLA